MQSRADGFWQTAIKRLWSKGWTDQDCAEALWDLSDEAILKLEACGWNRDTLAEALQPCSGDITWTARRVRYWRLSQDPPLVSRRPSPAIMQEARRWQAMSTTYQRGWGNYVGRSEEIRTALAHGLSPDEVAEELGVGWTADLVARWQGHPWDSLSSGELTLLEQLHDARDHQTGEPLALPSIALPLAHKRSESRGTKSYMGMLLQKGLVMRCGRHGHRHNSYMLYALAPGVCQHRPGTKTPTSLDRMLAQMGLDL